MWNCGKCGNVEMKCGNDNMVVICEMSAEPPEKSIRRLFIRPLQYCVDN
jgi:hypothetical protein